MLTNAFLLYFLIQMAVHPIRHKQPRLVPLYTPYSYLIFDKGNVAFVMLKKSRYERKPSNYFRSYFQIKTTILNANFVQLYKILYLFVRSVNSSVLPRPKNATSPQKNSTKPVPVAGFLFSGSIRRSTSQPLCYNRGPLSHISLIIAAFFIPYTLI